MDTELLQTTALDMYAQSNDDGTGDDDGMVEPGEDGVEGDDIGDEDEEEDAAGASGSME